MKEKSKVIGGVALAILIVFLVFLQSKNSSKIKKQETKQEISSNNQSDKNYSYNFGVKLFENGDFSDARLEFSLIPENDSNYSEAQKYIALCNKEIDKELKERDKLEMKYKKIFGGNGWLHEKKSRLMDLDFQQYKSGYEEAPDGSKQLAMYYKKFEKGNYIHVMLQYSYSSEHHYVRVWVDNE